MNMFQTITYHKVIDIRTAFDIWAELIFRQQRVTDKMLPEVCPFPVQRVCSNFHQYWLGTSCCKGSWLWKGKSAL